MTAALMARAFSTVRALCQSRRRPACTIAVIALLTGDSPIVPDAPNRLGARVQNSEQARLDALREQHVLDTPPEDRFDRITAMAAAYFDVPIALVSLIDSDRQWFKSCIGLGVSETPRKWAFCDHAIREGEYATLVVEDAGLDPRFADNPLVTGDPLIRFYAGAVLTTPAGENLGTLCVIDRKPRDRPSDADLNYLKALARLVVDQFELGRAMQQLTERRRLLDLAESLSEVGYWTLNTGTQAVFWSPQVYRIHGVDEAEFNPGLDDALAFYVEEDRQRITDLLTAQAAAGEAWQFDATIIRRSDGSRRSVRSVADCQKDSHGRVTGFVGVFKDLTDERRAVATAIDQERRYRLLADNASDVIAVYGVDGVFTYLSPSIRELLGYAPEELIGRTSYDLMLAEDRPSVAAQFAAAARSSEPVAVEYRALTRDGETRWLEARPRFRRDGTGRVTEIHDAVRDVTERREREAALVEAQAAAEAATLAKAQFLANMSHEIRTPLNGVLGFADALADTGLDAVQSRYLDRIRTAGRGLSSLIDDILDVSKIDAGKMTVEQSAFDLQSLTTEVVDLTRSAVRDRLVFDVVFADDVAPWIVGDAQRTRQVLLNLLGNAAKFTEQGSVSVRVSRVSDEIELRIVDTGVGVAPEALERLFEGFTQADSSIGRRFGGTGLGLTISRSLAQLMGGDIRLESVPGIGTSAIFTLPHKPAEPAVAPSAPAATPSASDRALRILAVDDVEANLELLDIILSGAGHDVVVAASGEAAIALLGKDPGFDLVLMDVQMPGMDGLEATRRIRALDGAAARVPVVALSANVMPDQVAACRAAGMGDHLGKPIRHDRLFALLARIGDPRVAVAAEPDAAPVTDVLADLKGRYRQRLDTLAAEFTELAVLPEAERVKAVRALAHSVYGTAGSLGFERVSEAAGRLEEAAMSPGVSGDSLTEPVRSLLAVVAAT